MNYIFLFAIFFCPIPHLVSRDNSCNNFNSMYFSSWLQKLVALGGQNPTLSLNLCNSLEQKQRFERTFGIDAQCSSGVYIMQNTIVGGGGLLGKKMKVQGKKLRW